MLSSVALATPPPQSLEALSQGQLERQLVEIDTKLDDLAAFSLRSGVGSVGYRSQAHPRPDQTEWVQIDLGKEVAIDQIVLVPTLWRGAKTGLQQEGFPEDFHLVAGTSQDEIGTVIASFTAKDRLLPRIAPLIVPCPGTRASWVRVEATLLSPSAWDGLCYLGLAEILVYRGQENVALHRPTQASSNFEGTDRQKEGLVDGFTPYVMNAAYGNKSIAFVSEVGDQERPSLTFDLGTSREINRIQLHAVDTSDNVPQTHPTDFGIPRRLVVEGANRPDFSDAVVLSGLHADTPFDTGPINELRFPETSCRFIRIIVVEPSVFNGRKVLGFAEIEIFSGGANVVRGLQAMANFEPTEPGRPISALTDGRNLYGTILPNRDWLGQLALRHDLETERPLVVAELNLRYSRQKTRLVWMSWLTTVLAVGIVLVILINRILRLRQAAAIRERFAADLHDELGADLHSIRLLGELALSAKNAPERLESLLQSSQEIAQSASAAVRHCMNMQDANGLYGNLKEDMLRAARRIMAPLEFEISVEGEEFLQKLKPRTRNDLFLFFKECLVNISRHADATRSSTRLTATSKEVCMVIMDNGRGLPTLTGKKVPKSLKRRARLMGARVEAGNSVNGGTLITLQLPTRRFGFRK